MRWIKIEKWTLNGKAFQNNLGTFWIPAEAWLNPPEGIAYIHPDLYEPKPWICHTVPLQEPGMCMIDPDFEALVPLQKEANSAT